MSRPVSVGELAHLLAAQASGLVPQLLPRGRRRGREWVEASTAQGGLGDSLSVCLDGARAGVWRHFAGTAGGDLIDLIAHTETAGDKARAIAWARQWLGLDPRGREGDPAHSAAIERARHVRHAARRAAEDDRHRRTSMARALWHRARPLEPGDVVDRYLAGRGIGLRALGRAPGALRAGQEVRRPDGTAWPALLAAVVSLDGRHVATHRTWLTEAGGKAPAVDGVPAKALLGALAGAHIPVWKGAHAATLREVPAGTVVFAAEGIEDALAVALMQPRARVIAACSVGNLRALELPPQLGGLVIVADNDAPGSPAAAALAAAVECHERAGRRTSVVRPPAGCKDIADWVRSWRSTAA